MMMMLKTATTLLALLSLAAAEVTVEETSSFLTGEPSHGRVVWLKATENTELRCTYNATLADTEDEDVDIKWTFIDGVHKRQMNEHGEEEGREDDDDEDSEDAVPVDASLVSLEDDGATSVLTLKNDSLRGEYICRSAGERVRFYVNYYFKLEKIPRSYTVMNGDDLLLPCNLKDTSMTRGNPVYHWYTKVGSLDDPMDEEGHGELLVPNTTVSNGLLEPHIKFLNSTTSNAVTVKIENAVYEDRAWYRCVVTNDFGQEDFGDSLVRVKYRYGALYPFLGIVAEVVVLCLVIYICERRKSNKEIEEEEDDDYQAGGQQGQSGNSNVRQRVR